MTTCPRCGHVAHDETVCNNCGLFLANLDSDAAGTAGLMDDLGFVDDDQEAAEVLGAGAATTSGASTLRVATIAVVSILLIAVGAVFLINMHSGSSNKSVAGPSESQSTVPVGLPNSASSTTPIATSSASSSVPYTHLPPLNPSSKSKSSSASRPSTSASSTRTSGTSTSAPPTGTTTGTSSNPPPPPPQSVTLSKSPNPQCGQRPHCGYLFVSLTNFPIGPHEVVCESGVSGQIGNYTTTSESSVSCSYEGHGTVWVVVDGSYKSNVVLW